jgi:hypothetical protein
MAIKPRLFIAIALCLMALGSTAQTITTMTNHSEKVAAILNAVELYAEAGRKASRTIGQQAFTQAATMSWVENGKITTVPITSLFDGLEQTGEEEVTYEVVDVNIAGNIAFVRIDSWFSKLGSFNDMFTLAQQDNGEWKIVSKIYSVK